MAKKINHRGHGVHRELLFSLCPLCSLSIDKKLHHRLPNRLPLPFGVITLWIVRMVTSARSRIQKNVENQKIRFGSTARIRTLSSRQEVASQIAQTSYPSIRGNPTAECADGNAHVVNSAGTTWKI